VHEPKQFTYSSTGQGQGGGEFELEQRIWLLDREQQRFSLVLSETMAESCHEGEMLLFSSVKK